MNYEPPNIFEPDTLPSKELRVLWAACYIPLGFVIPHFLGKGSEDFVAFHVRQGASFFVIAFLLGFPLGGLPWFVYIILSGISGYRAYLGQKFMLGFIRSIVEFLNKK